MFDKIKSTLTVTSLLYFLMGVIMLMFPAIVSDFVCYFVGLLFMFFGVAAIIMYFKTEIKTPYISTLLILGIFICSFGIYICLNPRFFASFIPLVVGIFMLADAISKLSIAFDMKKLEYTNWWHMFITSFIILVCGLLLVFNPFKAVTVSIMAIGAILIVDSITNIFTIYSYSKIIIK
ncbi:MAG: DUF308 domain-containing protein [Bacilli bacterium]|nr:DUF308 domain-containing protein [Bacilli bacterium]